MVYRTKIRSREQDFTFAFHDDAADECIHEKYILRNVYICSTRTHTWSSTFVFLCNKKQEDRLEHILIRQGMPRGGCLMPQQRYSCHVPISTLRAPSSPLHVTRRHMKRRIISYSKDEQGSDDVCWSVDDLDVLKAKLGMVEEIEQAIRQIEARVDALDDKLWNVCDEEVEQEVQIQRLIDEKDSEQGLHFDTQILSYPDQHKKPLIAGRKSVHVSELSKNKEHAWDTYRTSFTVVLTKGYLQAVEQLRERMLVQEWDQNLKQIARSNGISRFEAYCAIQKVDCIDYDVISELYKTHGKDLSCIKDEFLRMRCRSLIQQEENKMKKECYDTITEEARRLAKQFSEAEFLRKVLPDPIEHGLVSSVETLLTMFAHKNP